MHTQITDDNPYRLNRYAFAWHHVPRNSAAHLDFGCYDGAFLRSLDGKNIARRIGIDAARDPLERARRDHTELEFIHAQDWPPLPLPDKSVQSITILDVIEHVTGQHDLLLEFHRILRDDGVLIVTVPGQHFFSFLDLGNLKFRFPRLHRWWYLRHHSVAEYEARYVSNPDGLIGDVSADKAWHEHFSRRKLADLLEPAGFEVREFDGTGYFRRVMAVSHKFVGRLRPVGRLLESAILFDARCFESANLFCVALKRRTIGGNT